MNFWKFSLVSMLLLTNAMAGSETIETGEGSSYDGSGAACKMAKLDITAGLRYDENLIWFSSCNCNQAKSGDHIGQWTCFVDAKIVKK